jgi:bacteriorhodopsin
MVEYLVIVAAVASLLAAFVYIRSMFRGGTKPNRVPWLMWAIAPLIATTAAISNGVGWAVLPVFMAGFSPILIFTVSFFCQES